MKVSKTAIFLFELMVVVLIFSVAAAVCTNIFGKAYNTSTDSKALTMAVIRAESIAEGFKAGEMKTPDGIYSFFNVPDDVVQSYKENSAESTSESAIVYLNSDWEAVKNVHGIVKYAVSVNTAKLNGMNQMSIWIGSIKSVVKKGESAAYEDIYKLKVKSYGE